MILASLLTAAVLLCPLPAGETVDWFEGGYNAALKEARSRQSQLFIAFAPDWSDYSVRLVKETFSDPTVAAALEDFVCLLYDGEDSRSLQVARLYNVNDFPSIIVAMPDGAIEELISGFIPVGPLLGQLQRIRAADNTVSAFRKSVDQAPDDLERRWSLAVKLQAVGDVKAHGKEVDVIRRADPEGVTLVGLRLRTDDLWNEIAAAANGDGGSFDLAPMYAWCEQLAGPASYEAWNRLANFEASRGRVDEARDVFVRARPNVAEADLLDWSATVAGWMLEGNAENPLGPEHAAFALELATLSVERAEALRDPEAETWGRTYDGDDYDAFLAERLALLARCQADLGGDEESVTAALATTARCLELQPDNEEFVRMHDQLLAQR